MEIRRPCLFSHSVSVFPECITINLRVVLTLQDMAVSSGIWDGRTRRHRRSHRPAAAGGPMFQEPSWGWTWPCPRPEDGRKPWVSAPCQVSGMRLQLHQDHWGSRCGVRPRTNPGLNCQPAEDHHRDNGSTAPKNNKAVPLQWWRPAEDLPGQERRRGSRSHLPRNGEHCLSAPGSLAEAELVEHVLRSPGTKHRVRQVNLEGRKKRLLIRSWLQLLRNRSGGPEDDRTVWGMLAMQGTRARHTPLLSISASQTHAGRGELLPHRHLSRDSSHRHYHCDICYFTVSPCLCIMLYFLLLIFFLNVL